MTQPGEKRGRDASEEPELLRAPQGVYLGQTEEVISKIIDTRIGIGVFKSSDVRRITGELERRRYRPVGRAVRSRIEADDEEERDDLRRHDDLAIIVHLALQGSGRADFHWPFEDITGRIEGFEFDPETDWTVVSASDVAVRKGSIIVYPANTWRQFSTGPNQTLASMFRHYYPLETPEADLPQDHS